MTRVVIGSPASHVVDIDDPNGKLVDVARVAKRLWDQTTVLADDGKEEPKPGPAFAGFHTELRQPPDMYPNDLDGRTTAP